MKKKGKKKKEKKTIDDWWCPFPRKFSSLFDLAYLTVGPISGRRMWDCGWVVSQLPFQISTRLWKHKYVGKDENPQSNAEAGAGRDPATGDERQQNRPASTPHLVRDAFIAISRSPPF